jgi:hypothetical protein
LLLVRLKWFAESDEVEEDDEDVIDEANIDDDNEAVSDELNELALGNGNVVFNKLFVLLLLIVLFNALCDDVLDVGLICWLCWPVTKIIGANMLTELLVASDADAFEGNS